VALGEYPTVRYFKPPHPPPTHEAHILCSIIADAVQKEIDTYAQWNSDFPPPSNRPRAALYIVDRSFDLAAPFVHEFTYQAMAHDLLPIKDGDKVTFRTTINEASGESNSKDMEIGEKDKIWVENRHRHMMETIANLQGAFQKFLDQNPQFTKNKDSNNLSDIKDMLVGLPQFQEMKEAYSLNLTMAQDCMTEFQGRKLSDIAGLEQVRHFDGAFYTFVLTMAQTLATGLDEDYRKPKNIADQLVRMLDLDEVIPPDRLRLIALYVLFKDGILAADVDKLLRHAQLPGQDQAILFNLELLGAHVSRKLKDASPQSPPVFPRKTQPRPNEEEIILSRYETNLKLLLDEHVRGTLDPGLFPYIKPELAPAMDNPAANISTASLRSAKPTWARSKLSSIEPRQRIIVFMAGGATYSEARACYEVSDHSSREVVLMTSHMLTPGFFLQQLGDLSVDRRQLGIPMDRPAKRAPEHLFEKPAPPPPLSKGRPPGVLPPGVLPPVPTGDPRRSAATAPIDQMGSMSLNGGGRASDPSRRGAMMLPGTDTSSSNGSGKVKKDKYEDGSSKKKKHHFFKK
jgi:syntaxin-binding protein 1